jgi:hypothetical protein
MASNISNIKVSGIANFYKIQIISTKLFS